MAEFESAYLNADQEQKLKNVVNLAEKLTPFRYRNIQGRVQIPKGLGTIRCVIEGLQAASALEAYLEEVKKTPYQDIEDALRYFYEDVYNHEIEQIKNGKQVFVAEKDEAKQE